MMDKIKSHFVLLLCYDKIEPEVEVKKGGGGCWGWKKNAENSYFRLVSIYLYFTGVHCVCPANSWGKIGISPILMGLNEFEILQVVMQQYCNCLIVLCGNSKSQTWNWFPAKHPPWEDRGIYFPLSVCHITCRNKIILSFQWVKNNNHALAFH